MSNFERWGEWKSIFGAIKKWDYKTGVSIWVWRVSRKVDKEKKIQNDHNGQTEEGGEIFPVN